MAPSPEALREFAQAIADGLHRRYPAWEFIPREPGRPSPPGARIVQVLPLHDGEPVGDR